jgi:putative membrane protein
MTWESLLPPFNTALILISGLALLTGFFFIKRKNIPAHRLSMLTATLFAGLFLIVYVIRWTLLGSKEFGGEGLVKTVYYLVLITHIILAIGIVPLVIITLRRALQSNFTQHKKIAKVTFPIWLYVALSGWAVFWMLYNL